MKSVNRTEVGNLCYIRPLKDVLPANSDKVMYYFTILTQPKIRGIRTRRKHTCLTPSVCKNCVRCEDVECDVHCCVKRRHSFREVPVGEPITYLCKHHPWANKIIAIAHNAMAFHLHFIMMRAVFLKRKPELIADGIKIVSMRKENLVFLHNLFFLPCAMRKLHEDFGLEAMKSWYPH